MTLSDRRVLKKSIAQRPAPIAEDLFQLPRRRRLGLLAVRLERQRLAATGKKVS